MNETKENILLLKKYKYFLTKQQYRTLKGQILNYDFVGFKKGISKIINQKYKRR